MLGKFYDYSAKTDAVWVLCAVMNVTKFKDEGEINVYYLTNQTAKFLFLDAQVYFYHSDHMRFPVWRA